MLRIALTGPESTGKTTLCRQLAEHYGASWAAEYAREYLADSGPRYSLFDLEEIARGQLENEEQAAATGHGLVFCDTDLLVIKIWAEHSFGQCPDWVLRQLDGPPRYALTLLLGVDLPWEPDPLREHPQPRLRQHFYDLYLRELRARQLPFAEINGAPAQRFEQARYFIDALLTSGAGAPAAAARQLHPF